MRRLSFVHAWRVSVTPPYYLIYAIYHLNLGILYVGLTHIVPIQRLRKHMTDALAGTDGASLHRIMFPVEMAGCGIAVLEYVGTMWWAGIRERAWWFELRKWVVNEVAPGIPQEGKPSANHWHHQKVLQLLKEIKQAEYDQDYVRGTGMLGELSTPAQSRDIPLAYGASVVVPNVTKGQKSFIYRQLFRILHTTELKVWEKQAVKRIVRVVRSTPHTVQTIFNKLSTAKDWCSTLPKCTCKTHLHTAGQYGEL